MIKTLDNPIRITAAEYAKDKQNEGKTALFDLTADLLYAEGDSDDWVGLEEMKESRGSGDFYVLTVPAKKMVINSLGW